MLIRLKKLFLLNPFIYICAKFGPICILLSLKCRSEMFQKPPTKTFAERCTKKIMPLANH